MITTHIYIRIKLCQNYFNFASLLSLSNTNNSFAIFMTKTVNTTHMKFKIIYNYHNEDHYVV